jgi:hypothetical protein
VTGGHANHIATLRDYLQVVCRRKWIVLNGADPLVVDDVLRARDGGQADLDPLVGAVRAEAGAGDADPTVRVAVARVGTAVGTILR